MAGCRQILPNTRLQSVTASTDSNVKNTLSALQLPGIVQPLADVGSVVKAEITDDTADIEVDSKRVTLQHGDRLLLCTDGVWRELTEEALEFVLTATREPRDAVKSLVMAVHAAGGADNCAAIVIDVA